MTRLVQQIPLDVLQEIIGEAVFGALETVKERAFTLISCSQVCQQWRNAALDHKKLWALIIDFNHKSTSWVSELLERSKPHLIDFGTEEDAQSLSSTIIDSQRINLFLSHASRFRTLHLQGPICHHTVWVEFIKPVFMNALPSLECLHINSWQIPRTMTSFLNGNAAHLRKLYFTFTRKNIKASLRNAALPALEELYVYEIDDSPSVPEWITILSTGMPNLKRIDLKGAIKNIPPLDELTTHASNKNTSPLIHLEELSVDELNLDICISFVNALQPPSNCTVEICGTTWDVEDDVHNLSLLIGARVQTWLSQASRRLLEVLYDPEPWDGFHHGQISISNRRNIPKKNLPHLSQELSTTPQRSLQQDPHLSIMATLRCSSISEHITSLLSMLLQMEHTFETTTTLKFFHDDDFGPEFDAESHFLEFRRLGDDFFSKLYNLEVLMLHGDAPSMILPILTQDSSTTPTLLPRLECLVFEPKVGEDAGHSLYVSQIREFLHWRLEKGAPVEAVYMVVENKNLDSLKAVFGGICRLSIIDPATINRQQFVFSCNV